MSDEEWLSAHRKHLTEWDTYLRQIGRAMPCCSKKGYARYDYTKSEWFCSECGVMVSNDPSYPGGPIYHADNLEDSIPSIAERIKEKTTRKCDCPTIDLIRQGCKCNGV